MVFAADTRSEFALGARRTLPVLTAVGPFGAVFAAVATEQGLSAAQVLLASATIYAGASQFVLVDLWGKGVAPWAIVLTVLAVNFRHVLYSASLGRRMGLFSPTVKAVGFWFLVDPLFAEGEKRARETQLTPAFWFGYALVLWAVWMGANALGIVFGGLIEDPARWGLDLILPIFFTAIVVSFREASRFWSLLVLSGGAAIVAFNLFGTPWHIMAGGLVGMAYAAAMSRVPA